MDVRERNVEIKCPTQDCGAVKTIQIPDYLFEKKQVGLLKIQIHQGVCCDHQFIIFLDRKGEVKGYEHIDVQIDLSELSGQTVGQKLYIRDLLKMYSDFAVSNMLHAITLNYPILILRAAGEKNRANNINKLFNDYLPENYKNYGIVISIERKGISKSQD